MNRLPDYMLFGIQVILLVLFFWKPAALAEPLQELLRWIGTVSIGIGIVITLWGLFQLRNQLSPFPSPRQDGRLISDGIYAFVRHPVYSGILFAAFGLAIYEADPIRLVFAFALMIFFGIKASYEERRLAQAFPGYGQYKLRTGKFLPDWSAKADTEAGQTSGQPSANSEGSEEPASGGQEVSGPAKEEAKNKAEEDGGAGIS